MAVFKDTTITDNGRALLADALANNSQITFTRMVSSSKNYDDSTDVSKLINIDEIKQSVNMSRISQEGTRVRLNAIFTNQNINTSYKIQTIGLYAKVGTGNEILYSVTRAKEPDTMPATNSINLSTVEIDLITEINNSDGATIEFNPSTLVTFSTLATEESAGITKYGVSESTALEGKRLSEIIGLEFGGNIQNEGEKTTGKFYYDVVNKGYYECIVNNNLIYNESTKFRAISNKPISERLDNLFSSGNNWIKFPNGLIMQWGFILIPNGNDLVNLNTSFRDTNYQIIVSDSGAGTHKIGAKPLDRNRFQAYGRAPGAAASAGYVSSGFRWIAIGY